MKGRSAMPHRLLAFVARLALLALLCESAAAPRPAHAGSDSELRDLEETPYILRPGEFRFGLLKTQVGLGGHPILRRIQIGTHHLPWFALAAGAHTWNAHGKLQLYHDDYLTASIGAGHTVIQLGDEARFGIRAVPVEAAVAIRPHRRVSSSTSALHTRVQLYGMRTGLGALDELGGAVGTSTVQLRHRLEVAIGPRLTLFAGGRVVLDQRAYGSARTEEDLTGDERATMETTVETRRLDVTGSFSVKGGAHLSFDHFNLQLGLQYGHLNLPGLNVVIPGPRFMPVLDFYWRL